MSLISFLSVSLALLVALSSAEPITSDHADTTSAPTNLRTGARKLVAKIRDVADQARNGMYLESLHQDVVGLQATAYDLIQLLPVDVSECETSSVIKMAAAGTGSHEVLTVMLADDPLSVLNGRLSLALAFLEHVAQQLENELSLSSDVGPHLSAIVFGTNTTAAIIETADETVKATVDGEANPNHRVRRQSNRWRSSRYGLRGGSTNRFRTSVNLGRGWSVGLGGVKWQSRSGRTTFNARPTFSGIRPNGVRATLRIRF